MAEESGSQVDDPLAPKPTHFPAKAKRVIFLYMSGGVSHVDSWDPKPKLFADADKTVSVNEFQGRKGDFKMVLEATAVGIQATWKLRNRSERIVSAFGGVCR